MGIQTNIVECNKCHTQWHESVIFESDTNASTFIKEDVACPKCGEEVEFTLRPDYAGSAFNMMLGRLMGED